MAILAKKSAESVVAIVSTGSAGVVISESCFERLGLAGNDEAEYTITSATDTNKKLRNVLFGVEIAVEKSKRCIPAIVLEGLHFDVLLEMSWVKETNPIFKATEGGVSVNGKNVKYKPYPDLALFIVEEGVRVYSCELMVLPPRNNVGVPVHHQEVTRNKVYSLNTNKN